MLKNILNLSGAQEINKNEQKKISGGFGRGGCTGSGSRCCVQTQWGEFCDAGRCINGRYCFWY